MKRVVTFLIIASTCSLFQCAARAAAVYADTVDTFSGGSNFGVVDQSGGTYAGAAGMGVYDPLAVTQLDGTALALGGATGTPGSITMSFSSGFFFDGPGTDLRIIDTVDIKEGFFIEISTDGVTFYGAGSLPGSSGGISYSCSPATPCVTDVDIFDSGLSSAKYIRLTVAWFASTYGFPEGYDLDAIEAVNFVAASVPEPSDSVLFGIGVMMLPVMLGRRRHGAETPGERSPTGLIKRRSDFD